MGCFIEFGDHSEGQAGFPVCPFFVLVCKTSLLFSLPFAKLNGVVADVLNGPSFCELGIYYG